MTHKEKAVIFYRKTSRILAFFKPYWHLWFFLFLISLLLSALALANPLIIKFLIDNVLIAKDYGLLKIIMLLFIGLGIFTAAVRVITRYFYSKLELYILYDVRNKLFSHLERLDIAFFQKKKLGDLLTRLNSDIAGIEEFISLIFNGLVSNILTLSLILGISLYIDRQMTLLVLTVIPFYILFQRYYAGKLRGFYRLLKHQGAMMLSFFEEKLSAMALVQIFGREEYELQEEKRKSRRLIATSLKTTLTATLSGTVVGLLTFSALIFVLWYGGYRVIAGELTVGALIAIYSYLGGLFSPIEALAGLYTQAQGSLASVDRVFQILDVVPAVKEKRGATLAEKIRGEVVFNNVFFSYGNQQVLKGVSFKVSPGEVVGIVGESGSGKTTIANLIARFYDPQDGEVIIDGHNLKDVALRPLRKQVGLAAQNVVLFNAAIKENLLYGRRGGAPQAEIESAAKDALIHDLILTLPKKYNTPLGEKGMTLSGGERQRLALARLILKNPQIIILDEATSYLDFKNELEVMQNLRRVFSGKTMFIIAHRLSALEDIGRILVLKNGVIAEDGSFKELLAKKGEFFQLYNYQLGGPRRFREKLEYELQRALNEKLPLTVIGITVKNIEEPALLEQIAAEISTQVSAPYFSGQDINRKEIFYVALGETGEPAAHEFAARLTSHLVKKFSGIEISVNIGNASTKLKELGKPS